MPTLFLEKWPWGVASFGGCFLVQVIWWRIRRPRHDLVRTFQWFVLLPLLAIALIVFIPASTWIGFSWQEWLAPFVVHLLLGGNYLVLYPALQASSPSIQIISLLVSNPGLSETQILDRIARPSLIEDRLNNLGEAKITRKTSGGYELALVGYCLAGIFIWYRKLLGVGAGEG